MGKKRLQTVTIKRNRDGTYNFKSTGGYDLRKLFDAPMAAEMPSPAGETVRTTPGQRMEAGSGTETSSVGPASTSRKAGA